MQSTQLQSLTSLSWNDPKVAELIALALAEDIGDGDLTTEICVPENARARGCFLTRESLVLAGTPLLKLLYKDERVEVLLRDGSELGAEVVFAWVEGSARRLLTLERTALNLIQRACGVATLTRRYVEALTGTKCTLLDTRKTTPGMRVIEKLAVQAGGGTNHRIGLYDAVLIKNNHIDAAGGVRQALEGTRQRAVPIEIEVRDFRELDEAMACGARHILLDNFTPEEVARAVRVINGRARIEVSGNLALPTIRAYAEAGADFASVGALTHSAPASDISFRFE